MNSAVQLALNQGREVLLQEVAQRTGLEVARPTMVGVLVTYRCQMRCKQCNIWRWSDRREELSTQQWKDVLRGLRQWLGPCHIQFGGGEPFLRPDLVELFSYASELGIAPGTTTNGAAISDGTAQRLVNCGLFNLNISIDGIRPETHDYLRGVKGTFAKLMNAIEMLQRYQQEQRSRLNIMLKTTIMGSNLGELLSLLDFVEEQGITGIRFQLLDQNLGEKRDEVWYRQSELWVKDNDALDAVIDSLLERKRRGSPVLNTVAYLQLAKQYYRDPNAVGVLGGRCAVGWTSFNINANGDVQLCYEMPPIGNVTEATPRQIWTSTKARQQREQIARCRQSCIQLCRVKRSFAENVDLFLRLVGRQRGRGKQ